MKYGVIVCCLLLACITPCRAWDITIDPVDFGLITQNQFDDFVLDLGTAISFTPMTPAKTLGLLGLDISGELSVSDLSNSEAWKYLVEDNDTFSYLTLPRVHAQKGLPFGFDVGGMLATLPDSNVQVWGLELKKSLIDDGGVLPIPAVSVRASYSALEGVDDIDLKTYSLDLMVSKDVLMLTPYAAASYLNIEGKETSPYVTGLRDVERSDTRLLGGLQYSPFPFCITNFEVVLGDMPQYNLKVGIRF